MTLVVRTDARHAQLASDPAQRHCATGSHPPISTSSAGNTSSYTNGHRTSVCHVAIQLPPVLQELQAQRQGQPMAPAAPARMTTAQAAATPAQTQEEASKAAVPQTPSRGISAATAGTHLITAAAVTAATAGGARLVGMTMAMACKEVGCTSFPLLFGAAA